MEEKLWIDGRWIESQGGQRMEIINPATGATLAHVADASREDVDGIIH